MLKTLKSLLLNIILLFTFLSIPSTSFAQVVPTEYFPELNGYITDQANLLSLQTYRNLNSKLQNIHQQSGAELIIVTINSLQGYPIEDYALQLGRHWGIGNKDTNSGLIFLIAPNEREVRIETGYGLEGDLIDSRAKEIINQVLPHFKNGNYDQGILLGTDLLISHLTGNYKSPSPSQTQSSSPFIEILLGFLGVNIFLSIFYFGFGPNTIKSNWMALFLLSFTTVFSLIPAAIVLVESESYLLFFLYGLIMIGNIGYISYLRSYFAKHLNLPSWYPDMFSHPSSNIYWDPKSGKYKRYNTTSSTSFGVGTGIGIGIGSNSNNRRDNSGGSGGGFSGGGGSFGGGGGSFGGGGASGRW